EQIMSALIRAFEVMTNPATAGPATIALSQDVQGEAYDFPIEFFEKRIHYIDRLSPIERSLVQAKNVIEKAEKPLIIVGGGAKYSEAQHEITEFMHNTGIPMVETQAGKSTILSNETYNLGGIGVTGNSAANKYAKEADVIIGIGTRYSDFTTSSKTAFNFENTKFININVNRVDAYKLDAVQIVGDAKLSVVKLDKLLQGINFNTNSTISKLKEEWQKEYERLSDINVQN